MRFEQFKNLAKMREGAGNKLKKTIKKQLKNNLKCVILRNFKRNLKKQLQAI